MSVYINEQAIATTNMGKLTNEQFNTLLRAEVEKAHESLVNNGDISYICLDEEQEKVNAEWQNVLDKAFELVSDFAMKYGMEGLY